jgi:hypothetical protein
LKEPELSGRPDVLARHHVSPAGLARTPGAEFSERSARIFFNGSKGRAGVGTTTAAAILRVLKQRGESPQSVLKPPSYELVKESSPDLLEELEREHDLGTVLSVEDLERLDLPALARHGEEVENAVVRLVRGAIDDALRPRFELLEESARTAWHRDRATDEPAISCLEPREAGRELWWIVEPPATSAPSTALEVIPIDGAGRIRRVVLDVRGGVSVDVGGVAKRVHATITQSYRRMEESVVRGLQQLNAPLVSDLYDLIRPHAVNLEGKLWFAVADAELNAVVHMFCTRTASLALNHYREHRDGDGSPIELTTTMLADSLPYNLSLTNKAIAARREAGLAYLSLAWDRASYRRCAPRIHTAERLLHSHPVFCAVPVATVDGRVLVVSCRNDVVDRVQAAVERVRAQATRRFREGAAQWPHHLRRIGVRGPRGITALASARGGGAKPAPAGDGVLPGESSLLGAERAHRAASPRLRVRAGG